MDERAPIDPHHMFCSANNKATEEKWLSVNKGFGSFVYNNPTRTQYT